MEQIINTAIKYKQTRLYLYNNQLTCLPESLGNLTQLKGLYLHGNQLTCFHESLGNLTQLKWLIIKEGVNCANTFHKLRKMHLFVADEAFELLIHY